MSIKKEFNYIFEQFNKTGNYSSTCDRLISWIEKYKDNIKTISDINDILHRVGDPTDELQDIIDDFISGSKYKTLRNEFHRK
jgi:hypothetical protein